MEGSFCGGWESSGCPSGVPACNSPGLVLPILEYSHSGGRLLGDRRIRLSRTSFPRLVGTYLYGDSAPGKSGAATSAAGSVERAALPRRATNLTTFGEDAAGEVYLGTESGLFARIVDADPVAPTIVSLDATSGPVRGGDVVVLTGSGFFTGVVVTFGGVPGTDVAVLDSTSTRLRVVTPAHAAGPVDVVVTNADGRSATLPAAYVFEPFKRTTGVRSPLTTLPARH